MCCWLSPFFLTTGEGGDTKNKETVNALREVQAVNVHNIPHYIHVISECTRSDAVSNLCDRFRWTLVKGAQRGESGLGLTQASKYKISSRQEGASLSARAAWLFCPPTPTAKIHTRVHAARTHKLYGKSGFYYNWQEMHKNKKKEQTSNSNKVHFNRLKGSGSRLVRSVTI